MTNTNKYHVFLFIYKADKTKTTPPFPPKKMIKIYTILCDMAGNMYELQYKAFNHLKCSYLSECKLPSEEVKISFVK